MSSLDYISNAELQPSINRLKGLLNKLADGRQLENSDIKAVIAILMAIYEQCDEEKEKLETLPQMSLSKYL